MPSAVASMPSLRAQCSRALCGGRRTSPREMLLALAERADASLVADSYGEGAHIAAFESRVAEMLGMEAAVFMPSGTMAQQIALRVWCERARSRTAAFHPLSHLEIHERDGYHALHGLRSVHVGTTSKPATLRDVEAIAEPVAALLLELPQRELGGTLPSWDELVATVGAARSRGMRVHLDGARLWESQPYYGRPLDEIASLFDSAYVSFYKVLGGIAGAMLLGERSFIDEARIWQRRHGGNLIALYPYVLAAERGLDDALPRVPSYVARAARLAHAFAAMEMIDVAPGEPPTNMMHLFVHGDAAAMEERARVLAEDEGIWAFERLAPTANPHAFKWEFTVGEATMAFSESEIVAIVRRLVSSTAS